MSTRKTRRAAQAKANSMKAKYARAARRPDTTEKLPTLGWLGHCWCGEPNGHEWPGREEGKPHPR